MQLKTQVLFGVMVALLTSMLDARLQASEEKDDTVHFPLMVGFKGTTPQDPEVIALTESLKQGHISGVILFAYNIVNPDQVCTLTRHFLKASGDLPCLVALDQEGGKVQRLRKMDGYDDFHDVPSAEEIGALYRQDGAGAVRKIYDAAAAQVRDAGFNYVFGPVVDLLDPISTIIAKYQRAYSADPLEVAACGKIFVEAHRAQGIATSPKHFPGHGKAYGDTHEGFVDVSKSYVESERLPFEKMIQDKDADSLMMAHIFNKEWDEMWPVSASPYVIQQMIRTDMAYDGVLINDDLCMGAIVDHWSLPDMSTQMVRAGIDLLLCSYNKAAAQGTKGLSQTDYSPGALQATLKERLGESLYEEKCRVASLRVTRLRQSLFNAW
ncbi:MAG: glycoside hydrolase family 3 protein [Alphaproteobacteria bacterium]|nr:glycoside hydrolase family 3 protein [Alphaproteobacteria bacterium]